MTNSETAELAAARLPERQTGKDFAGLLNSGEYSGTLASMNSFTREKNREVTSKVYKALGRDEYHIKETSIKIRKDRAEINEFAFLKGKSSSVQGRTSVYTIENEGNLNLFYPLISMHTHPRESYLLRFSTGSPAYRPSPSDLHHLAYLRLFTREHLELDVRPVEVISVPFESRYAALLLFQEKTDEPQDVASCNETYKHLRRRMKTASVTVSPADLLEETGRYNAAYILFDEEKGLSVLECSVEKFSFEAVKLPDGFQRKERGRILLEIDKIRLEGLYGYARNRLLP